MVAVTDPRLGETVLDPASGTGGFLLESYNHLAKQVKTVADRKILQEKSLYGCEPKPLPYLLCQMNLLLHGLDAPQIDPGNALRHKLTDIGERDRPGRLRNRQPDPLFRATAWRVVAGLWPAVEGGILPPGTIPANGSVTRSRDGSFRGTRVGRTCWSAGAGDFPVARS
jgi:hypothetical protein